MSRPFIVVTFVFVFVAGFLPSTGVAQTFGEVRFSYDVNGNRVSNSIWFGVEMRKGVDLDTLYVSGLTDALGDMEVALFPNPTPGKFTVSLNGSEARDTRVMLSTIGGVPLDEKETKNGMAVFDLSVCPAGLYLVVLTVNGETKAWRVLKK